MAHVLQLQKSKTLSVEPYIKSCGAHGPQRAVCTSWQDPEGQQKHFLPIPQHLHQDSTIVATASYYVLFTWHRQYFQKGAELLLWARFQRFRLLQTQPSHPVGWGVLPVSREPCLLQRLDLRHGKASVMGWKPI